MIPSSSAPAGINGTPKMHKFSSKDTFPKPRPIVSSIDTFNYDLTRFRCDLLHPQYLMITLAKILFLSFLKLRTQIFSVNFLVPTM